MNPEPSAADHLALIEAIRAFTVDAPGGKPNGPAEQAIDDLSDLLNPADWPEQAQGRLAEVNGVMARLCEALADDTKRLKDTAETYFGGNFGAP